MFELELELETRGKVVALREVGRVMVEPRGTILVVPGGIGVQAAFVPENAEFLIAVGIEADADFCDSSRREYQLNDRRLVDLAARTMRRTSTGRDGYCSRPDRKCYRPPWPC